jgi:hypothetical protein
MSLHESSAVRHQTILCVLRHTYTSLKIESAAAASVRHNTRHIRHKMTLRDVVLCYSTFVEMFEPTQDFSGCEYDGLITLLVKDVKDTQCAFLWKPLEPYTGKWMRMRYNGSSPFAMWWSQMCGEESDETVSSS